MILFAHIVTPAIAHAQEPGASIYVVHHGGIVDLPRFDLVFEPNAKVRPAGALHITSEEKGALVITDAWVLPNTTLLLAGRLDQEGIGIFDPASKTHTLIYKNISQNIDIQSATISSYTSPGAPLYMLWSNSMSSSIHLHDTRKEEEIWAQSLFLASSAARISQAISMPGGKIAVAANWTNLGMYGVEILTLHATTGIPQPSTRIANMTHPDQPEETYIIEDLGPMRELMALDVDTLLITTQFTVYAITLQGDILWSIRTSDFNTLGGEFAGARKTPSGHIVAATFEPGVWTSPHHNHRVHYFDTSLPDGPKLIASSDVLGRAPRRVLSVDGTGGTGTFEWHGIDTQIGEGTLSQLQIASSLSINDTVFDAQDELTGTVTLRNTKEQPVSIKRFVLTAIKSATCLASGEPDLILFEDKDIVVPGQGTTTLSGQTVLLGKTFTPGNWCVSPAVQGDDGVWLHITTQQTFRMRDPQDRHIPTIDLRRRTPDDDMDMGSSSDSDADKAQNTQEPSESCACTSLHTPRDLPHAPATIAALAILLGIRKGVRKDIHHKHHQVQPRVF